VPALTIVEDLEILEDRHAESAQPDKDMVANYWRGLALLSKLWGLDAPTQAETLSTVVHADAEPAEGGKTAREFLTELAVWARKTKAINVEGYQPPLPPGMTERPTPVLSESHGHANGNGDSSSPSRLGKGMWSIVLEHPAEED
jgi:hypothetical protein